MAPPRTRSSVVVMMKAFTTDISVDTGQRRARALDGLERHEPPLDDTTAPARRGRAPRRDDETHTPPHGDAVLPRPKPAQ
jgi:hypothetical protein